MAGRAQCTRGGIGSETGADILNRNGLLLALIRYWEF